MVVKHIGSFAAALVFSLLIFSGMQLLIANDGVFTKKDRQQTYLNFVRVDANQQEVTTKDRRMPDPPAPPENPPETPSVTTDAATANTATATSIAMNIPNISVGVNKGTGPFVGTLQQGGGLAGFDTDVIPLVRVPAAYPQKAKRAKLTGYVTMEVNIRPDGTVSNVKVVKAEPPRLFDKAAVSAMKRWKFRPKMVDGKPQEQRARQTIEFTLGNKK